MLKLLSVLFILSSPSFGQELWNGTRYGMSKAEVEKLFDGRLKANEYGNWAYVLTMVPWVGGADTPEHFCDSDFQVTFFFDEREKGLAGVGLESLSGENPDVGACAVRQLTIQFGRPTDWSSPAAPGVHWYWFHRLFSRPWIVLCVQPHRVTISYGRQRPHRYSSFP